MMSHPLKIGECYFNSSFKICRIDHDRYIGVIRGPRPSEKENPKKSTNRPSQKNANWYSRLDQSLFKMEDLLAGGYFQELGKVGFKRLAGYYKDFFFGLYELQKTDANTAQAYLFELENIMEDGITIDSRRTEILTQVRLFRNLISNESTFVDAAVAHIANHDIYIIPTQASLNEYLLDLTETMVDAFEFCGYDTCSDYDIDQPLEEY